MPVNQWVAGSSPAGGANQSNIKGLQRCSPFLLGGWKSRYLCLLAVHSARKNTPAVYVTERWKVCFAAGRDASFSQVAFNIAVAVTTRLRLNL
jgi:hypothetical protein